MLCVQNMVGTHLPKKIQVKTRQQHFFVAQIQVQEVLLKVELGDRGINSQGLDRMAGLPSRNQMLGSMEVSQ